LQRELDSFGNKPNKISLHSSAADSSSSDTSDNESMSANKSENIKQKDLLIIKEFDWNRSASSSSRSRNKIRLNNLGANLNFLNGETRIRPSSISSDNAQNDDLNDKLSKENHSFVIRTKSLAEEG
jgi:hypothetical protein